MSNGDRPRPAEKLPERRQPTSERSPVTASDAFRNGRIGQHGEKQANARDAFKRKEGDATKPQEARERQGEKKPGRIDESERQFDRKRELPIAQKLQSEGHDVKALKEGQERGKRSADAEVDGKKTEFKKLDPGATDGTVKGTINDSLRRGGQARDIVIDARGSGLSEADARHGLDRARGISRGRLDSARIIGDKYDITYKDFEKR